MAPLKLTYPFEVKYLEIHDRINIAYCDEGRGEQTILFIHGLANYLPVWKNQINVLSKTYRCIAIDLPGNGLSSRGDYPYSMFFYAECVRRFIEGLHLPKVILAGHSMGGQIGIITALRYPAMVEKLLLLAPAGIEYFQPHERLMMQPLMNLGDFFYADEFHLEQAIHESFFSRHQEREIIIEEIKHLMKQHPQQKWRDMVMASIKGMLNEQVQQFLPQLQQPVLLLFGTNDRLIPNRLIHPGETTESIAVKGGAMIENCSIHLVEKSGHFLMIEQHTLVNKLIQEFLEAKKSS